MKTPYFDCDGTLRAKTIEETLTHLNAHLNTIGITRVANITGLDHIGIPVATCIRPLGKHLSISQGKGVTLAHAKVSAIMEAMEAYHAEHPPEIICHGDYETLKHHHPVVDPKRFAHGFFPSTPLLSKTLPWCHAMDLCHQKTAYLPHTLTTLFSDQAQPNYLSLSPSSNGLAAGNTHDEASCHALYEVIERDALVHFQQLTHEEQHNCVIDLNTVNDPHNCTIIEAFHRADIYIKVWDITNHYGIPSFHCVIHENNPLRAMAQFTGTGTHLCKKVALSRALTEAAQSRLAHISGNRDDIFPDYYQDQQANKAFIQTKRTDPQGKSYHSCHTPTFEKNFSKNVEQLIQTLKSHGHDHIYAVTHTKPFLNIPVVQIIIPSMRFVGVRM